MTVRQSFRESRLARLPIAHRGLHNLLDLPENSMAAFQAAIDAGTPIELDVRLLADGQVVVFHDPDTLRMTGVDHAIGNLTAADLRQLRLRETPQHPPLLEEVLDLVRGQVPLLIEFKPISTQVGLLEQAALALLEHYTGEFAVQSFHTQSVLWFHDHAPHIWRGQLTPRSMGKATLEETRPDFIACGLHALLPRDASIDTEQPTQSAPVLLTWTVRDLDQLQYAQANADNFIFDRSDELMAAIMPKYFGDSAD
jgi:glycerophosphoryl diester phosphodiesterase